MKCSLGCPWEGELRHLEKHISPSDEGDCPLVEVSCRHGCGQVMPRAQEKNHEEESCSKRPIELQLARLHYHMDRKLEEMKMEHEKEMSQLKETIAEQKKEIADLKELIQSARPKSESVSMILPSYRLDVLHIMPKLPTGNIPGVLYYPSKGKVEIYASCDEELTARCSLFRVEYQKMLFALRSRNMSIPEKYDERKLQDFMIELNIKYVSSYVFMKETGGKPVLKILSIVASQVDEIAKLVEAKIGSMKINYIQLSGNRRITLKMGDIVKEDVDIIVSGTNKRLAMDIHGVARALNKASNGELKNLTEEYVSAHGPLESGDIAVTSSGGGTLKCKHVFHFAGATSTHSFSDSTITSILEKGLTKVLSEVERLEAKSIAIPAVGAGSYLLKNEVIASSVLSTLKNFKFSSDSFAVDIRVVVFNSTVYPSFVKAFDNAS